MSNETNTLDNNLAVLDQIRDSLAITLQTVERQEQALADSILQNQTNGEQTVIWHHTLDRLGDRFREWGDRITFCMRRASQVEMMMLENEQQMMRCRDNLNRSLVAITKGPRPLEETPPPNTTSA